MDIKILNGRKCFYQWDTRQILVVEGAEECNAVHFSNKANPMALVCQVREQDGQRVVDVPNILLQEDKMFTAYLFCYAEEGSETRYAKSFQVLRRPKPESYVYTETETLNYDYLDKRLTELEGEGLAKAVADYLEENPVEAGATSWNDLKDKPFYTETVTITHVKATTADFGLNGSGTKYFAVAPVDRMLVIGEVATVVWDGTPYKVEVYDYDGFNYIGDRKCTTMPFNAYWDDYNGAYSVHIECLTPPATVTVLYDEVVVHRIEPKYLPNSVWTETETKALLEETTVEMQLNASEDEYYTEVNLTRELQYGEVVTVVWNGVPYTLEVWEYDCCHMVGDRKLVTTPFDFWEINGVAFTIHATLENGATATVSVMCDEEVVYTNCDFMVALTIDDSNDVWDAKVLSGDFATVKAKNKKGLPVTAFAQLNGTYNGGETNQLCNGVCNLSFTNDNGNETFWGCCDNIWFGIQSDNTAFFD